MVSTNRPDPQALGTLQRLRFLASDTAIYGIAAAVNKGFGLLLFPLLVRNLTVAQYGTLDIALYASMLIGLVLVWGQDSAVARLFFEYEGDRERQEIISQGLLLIGGMSVVIATAAVAFYLIAPDFDWVGRTPRSMILLVMAFAIVSGLLSFCQGVLKWTFERNRYVSLALGVPATTLAGIALLAQTDRFTPMAALAVMTGVAMVFAVVAVATIRRWLIARPGLGFLRSLIPLALPYGAIATISATVPLMERGVVSGRFGAEELGLYAAAAKIASIAAMLGVAFQMGWGPFAYSIYRQENAIRTYNLVLRAFAAIVCIAVLGLSALAEPVTAVLAGDRYRGAALFVFPLAMVFAVQAIGWITELGIHLSKRTYLNLIGFGCYLAISLAGMFYLSRAIGMIGVPLGALAGQIAMLLISATVAQRAHRMSWDYRIPATSVVLTLASGAAALTLPGVLPGARAWWFFAGGIVALLAVNLAFGFGPADRARLRNLVETSIARFRGRWVS